MDAILLDFPSSFETERLQIRKAFPGDGLDVNEAICASIEELKPWMDFAQKIPTAEKTEKNIRKAHVQFLTRENLLFHVYHKEESYFIGSVSLNHINWDIPKCEIGYWVHSAYAKNGYMTEAVDALTTFGFNKLSMNRIEICCDSKNNASRKLAERLNFRLEGILKNDSLSMDKTALRDLCIYAKTK